MSQLKSPFSSRFPATVVGSFVGREKDINEMLIGLKGVAPRSFGIKAGTKMGKTSLLLQVTTLLKKEWSGVLLYVFIDANEVPSLSAESILQLMKSKLISEALNHLSHIDEQEIFEMAGFSPSMLPQIMAILAILDRQLDMVNIVFVLDHFDRLASMEDWDFLNRQLAILVGNVREPVSLLLAGSPAAIGKIEANTSPLATLLDIITLTSFSREETISLIQRLPDRVVTDSVVDFIFIETGGHPFLIQYIMEQLYDQLSGKLDQATPEAIIPIIDEFYKHRSECQRLFNRLTDLERQIYYHFVFDREPEKSRYELSQMGLTTPDEDPILRRAADLHDIDDALEVLTANGLLRELANGHYRLTCRLYARYFSKYVESAKDF